MKLPAYGWSLLGASVVGGGAALMSGLAVAVPEAAIGHDPAPEPRAPVSAARTEPPAPSAVSESPPAASTAPSSIPDLAQNDPALGFPRDGGSHCGPVAASDVLMQLSSRGWPRLAPEGASEKERHVALAVALATDRYMGTSSFGGTPPTGVLAGLERWVHRAGYRIRSLGYQGWRAHPARFGLGVRTPDPRWLSETLEQGGTALIHVGWYRLQHWDLGYVRSGGHWLAVAAVRLQQEPPELVLADPAPYAGAEPHDEVANLIRIERGYLKEGGATLAARGFFVVGGALPIKRKGEIAILDGAIALVLERP